MRKLFTFLLICALGLTQTFAQFSTDVSVSGITPTGGTICDGTYPVTILVTNADAVNPTNGVVPVNYYLDGVLIATVNTLAPLAGGGSELVVLGNFGNKPGKHNISIVANYTGDINPLNNAANSALIVKFNGTYTIGALPGSTFPTVKKAVDSVNAYGLCGPTVFNCQTGGSETSSEIVLYTTTTSATNTLTFNGSGYTITAGTGINTTTDGIIKIAGTDYVTLDGFTLLENAANVTATTQMEWGIALLKQTNSAPFNGCQYNVIKNCIISLNRTNVNSVGIYVNNHIANSTTVLTITAVGDANSFNKFDGNIISNVFIGIYINGYNDGTSPYALYDQSNEIGATKGNRIYNFAGGAATSYGIYARYQNNAKLMHNNINNLAGGGVVGASTLYGIYHASSVNSVATITFDTISLAQGAVGSQVGGIVTAVSGTRKVTISDNLLQNISGTTSTGTFYAIALNISSGGYPDSVILNNNRIINCTSLATTGSFYAMYCNVGSSYVMVQNNRIDNISKLSAGASFYGYYNFGSPSSGRETISNNKVSNITLNGATSFYGFYTSTGSGQNKTITYDTVTSITAGSNIFYGLYSTTGNTVDINNLIVSTVTVGSTLSYGIYCSSGTTVNLASCKVNSVTAGAGFYGIYLGTSVTTANINTNIVNTISAGGTVYGMQLAGTNYSAYSNKVYDLSTSGSSVAYGLYLSSTNGTVYKNEVYNLNASAAGGSVAGIFVTTGTTHYIYNNFISDLKAPIANAANAVIGINLSGGTTLNVYYNTIYLNASSTGTLFGSSGINASTTPTIDLRNNIVVNRSTPNSTGYTVAYRRSTTTLTSYASTSNNNLFYAGTPGANNVIFYDGTTAYQTLANYKLVPGLAPRDANSVTESTTPFNNIITAPYNLHLTNAVGTQCESGGIRITTPIAVTNDFDGDIRWGETGYAGAGSGVDIGADEGNFTGMDLTGPGISYTALANTTSTTTVPFANVSIIDPSGVDTTTALRARCYFKKKTNANTFNDNTNGTDGWKYVKANGQVTPFDFTINQSLIFGGVAVGDTVQYFVVAQDKVVPANLSLNSGTFAAVPTDVNLTSAAFPIGGTINYYKILPSICGNFTIGAGGNFATITAAVADLNSKVISCPVVYTLLDTLYRAAETFPIVINANLGSSATNTVTFKPASGVNARIKSGANGTIRLNGADYITFDGSNNGTTSRNLIIQDTNTSSAAAFWFGSTGTATGATYNVLKNCVILGGSATTSGLYGVFLGSSSSLGSSGNDNDNNTIQNCDIQKTYYGIYALASSTGVDNNLSILNNSIGSSTASNYIGNTGLYTSYIDGGNISGNTIFKVVYSSSTPYGMNLNTSTVNTTVSKNVIRNIEYTGTGGYGGRGIYVNTGSTTSNITLSNNMVAEIKGDGYSGFGASSPVGIFLDGTTGGINVWFNSVFMSGNLSYNTGTLTTAMLLYTSTITNVDLRNNIFENTMNNPNNSSAKNYAIYSAAANTAFTKIDYNDYYVSGAQGVFGYIASADVASLSAWKTATAKDTNSINVDPAFTSTIDLHTASVGVYHNGKTISGITTDIDGDVRNNPPCLGADEFTLASGDAGIFAVNRAYCPGSQNVVVTLKNFGGTNLTSVKIDWSVNSVPQTQFSWTGTLAPGATTNVTLTPAYTFAGSTAYTIVATTSLPNGVADGNTSNDSKTETGIYTGLAGTVVIGPAGTYATLTAATTDMNSSGICGPVILELNAAYVSSAETFPIVFNQIAGVSATNTITLRPATGVTAAITGSSASTIIKILGTDYVTIDGSNNGTSTRDLTISNTGTSTSSGVIWIGSVGSGATNNTVKNCIITGNSSTTTAAGIVIGSGTTFGSAAEFANDNTTIQNNLITKMQNAVYHNGFATTPYDQNLTITGNTFGSSTVASKLGYRGMILQNVDNFTVSGNTILGVVTSTSSTTTGIQLGSIATNGSIVKNSITDIKNTNALGYGSNGMYLGGTSTTSNILIANNMISDVASYGYTGYTSADNGYGIFIYAGGGYKLYFNSVNMATNQNSSSGSPACLNISSNVTATAAIDVQNNIFANTQTVGVNRYCVYSGAASTVFSTINYNDYYFTGPNLGNIGSDRANLSAWQTGTGQDANSISLNPGFTTATNLHILINNGNVNGKATYLAAVPNDFDNDVRNLTTPDMGADEYTPITKDLQLSSIVSPVSSTCYSANESFIVKVSNPGIDTVRFNVTPVTVTGTVTGPNPQTYNYTLNTGYLATGQNINVTFTTAFNMLVAGTYTFDSYFTWNLDQNHLNDSLPGTLVLTSASPSIDSIKPTNTTICQGSSTTLHSYTTVHGTIPSSFTKDTVLVAPDPGTTTSEIISTYPGTANQILTAVIDSLKHTYVSDLVLTLIAPNGSTALLSSENGGSGDNYLHTVFSMSAGTSITAGTAPFTGTFLPEGSFTTLTGTATGTWKLKIQDLYSGDQATLNKWSLNFPPLSNSIVSYSWSPTTGLSSPTVQNPVASPSVTTTYTLTVTDARGCTAVSTVTVNVNPAPVPVITGTNNLCQASSGVVYKTHSGMSNYVWSVSAGGTITSGGTLTDSTATVTWNNAGPQTISVNYNNLNSCPGIAPTVYNVTVNPLPTAVVSTPSASICAGQVVPISIALSGTGPWLLHGLTKTPMGGAPQSLPDTTVSVSPFTLYDIPTGDATYHIETFTDNATGCTNDTANWIGITVNPIPTASIAASTDTVCVGSTVNFYITLSGTGPWLLHGLTMIPQGGSPAVLPDTLVTVSPFMMSTPVYTNADFFITSFTDQSTGCTGDTANWVSVAAMAAPVVNLGVDTVLCADLSIVLDAYNAGATYLWSTTATTPSITLDSVGLGMGAHNISVGVSKYGCTVYDTIIVTFDPCSGINEVNDNVTISVVPNPSNGMFYLTVNGMDGNAVMEIYDITGQNIYSESVNGSGIVSKPIDLTGFAKGMYFVRVSNGTITHTEKLIVN